jgi:hypothetical protein
MYSILEHKFILPHEIRCINLDVFKGIVLVYIISWIQSDQIQKRRQSTGRIIWKPYVGFNGSFGFIILWHGYRTARIGFSKYLVRQV